MVTVTYLYDLTDYMQSLPKLEGFIHHLPETVYVGDLRCIALELKNPCKIPVKVCVFFCTYKKRHGSFTACKTFPHV